MQVRHTCTIIRQVIDSVLKRFFSIIMTSLLSLISDLIMLLEAYRVVEFCNSYLSCISVKSLSGLKHLEKRLPTEVRAIILAKFYNSIQMLV